jgi:hypothetical protein
MGRKKTVVHHTPSDLTARGDWHIISGSDNEDEDSPIAVKMEIPATWPYIVKARQNLAL